jgi:hypothetical protein
MQMKLLSKLTLLALGISSIPLAIEGYSSYRIGQAAVRAAVDESELQMARQVGQYVSSEIDHLVDTLRVDSRVFDLTRSGDDGPTPQGITKFLQLVYHQSDAFLASPRIWRAPTNTIRSRATSRCVPVTSRRWA